MNGGPSVQDKIVSRDKEGLGGAKDSIVTRARTVAELPAAPEQGERAFVTDSNAASYTAGIGTTVAAVRACPSCSTAPTG